MTEHDLPAEEHERLARRAVWDYLSVGPEPGFGDVEVEALNDWIEAGTRVVPEQLRSQDSLAFGWMHIERGWSRAAEADALGRMAGSLDEATIAAVKADLAKANEFFEATASQLEITQHNYLTLRGKLAVSKFALPMFDLLLTGQDGDLKSQTFATYRHVQFQNMALLHSKLKQGISPQDLPMLDVTLGLFLLTQHFAETDMLPLPASLRHSQGAGSPYYLWHAALHDRDNGQTHKVRIAPYGPPDTILITPDMFDHAGFPEFHGRGTFKAAVQAELWRTTPGSVFREPDEYAQRMLNHSARVSTAVEMRVSDQLLRRRGLVTVEAQPPAEPIAWYKDLPPLVDPCHPQHLGALEQGINELELQLATDTITPEDAYLLGWMLMESGLSYVALDTERTALLAASLERAEDIFAHAREHLPAGSARYYEATLSQVAAPMYRAIITTENTAEATDIYCSQLAELAGQMLRNYQTIPQKKSPEAEALAALLQRVTVYLLATHSPERSYIALPAAPRQRHQNDHQGWDFTMWVLEGEDTYVPGMFYGRLEEKDSQRSLDYGVMTLPLKALGQWTPAHDFRVLRTLLANLNPDLSTSKNFKPDKKATFKAQQNVLRIVAASDN